MNSYQTVFLIFILLPIILSPIVDFVTDRIKNVIWIAWHESIILMYMLEMIIIVLVAIFVMLGDA